MIVRISKSDEAFRFVQLSFVHEPDGPLTGPFQTAADALTAGDRDWKVLESTAEYQLALAACCSGFRSEAL